MRSQDEIDREKADYAEPKPIPRSLPQDVADIVLMSLQPPTTGMGRGSETERMDIDAWRAKLQERYDWAIRDARKFSPECARILNLIAADVGLLDAGKPVRVVSTATGFEVTR